MGVLHHNIKRLLRESKSRNPAHSPHVALFSVAMKVLLLSLLLAPVSAFVASSSSPVSSSARRVVSDTLDDMAPVSDEQVGGRIAAAFGAAKDKSEAAFVSFVTAGYPRAEGRLMNPFNTV